MPELSHSAIDVLKAIAEHPNHTVTHEEFVAICGGAVEYYLRLFTEVTFNDRLLVDIDSDELPCNFSLTPAALDLLNELRLIEVKACQDRAQKEADDAKRVLEQRKESRHNWEVSLVSAAVGSLTTLLVEHFSEILSFVLKLFQ